MIWAKERNIISDIVWSVELEPEVEDWMESLPARQCVFVLAHVERLAERGNQLRMPASPAVASCVDHVPQATTQRAC
jgi:hypothetical protein